MKKVGFTLAEVLITLAIIGVVAAITIPTIVINSQKNSYLTSLKKAYTNFNQVLIKMAADNGCTGDLKCTGFFDTDANTLGQAFVKYFKIAKDCGTTEDGCWADKMSGNYDGSDGKSDTSTFSYIGNRNNNYQFITTDGIAYSVDYTSCMNEAALVNAPHESEYCGVLFIDVNGLKGPNNYGRDMFWFGISNGKGPLLYPAGGSEFVVWNWWWQDGSGNPRACSPANPEGDTCTGRIIEQNWQMLY